MLLAAEIKAVFPLLMFQNFHGCTGEIMNNEEATKFAKVFFASLYIDVINIFVDYLECRSFTHYVYA